MVTIFTGRNEVLAKVRFSQASVILLTGGAGVSQHALQVSPVGGGPQFFGGSPIFRGGRGVSNFSGVAPIFRGVSNFFGGSPIFQRGG